MFRFKVRIIDPDGNEMVFFIETEAGNEKAAKEMVQWMIDSNLWKVSQIETVE